MITKKANLQLSFCEYMEKTYGKNWEKKNLNRNALLNSFMEGYKTKDDEQKTVHCICMSKKRAEYFKENIDNVFVKSDDSFPEIGKFLGIKIVGKDFMPDHLGACVDGDYNVISFIEFEEEKQKD